MAQDTYNEVAVAAIDLLGFKEQIKNNIDSALRSIELLRESSRKYRFGVMGGYDPIFQSSAPKPDINPSKEFFGDSVFFYANPEAPIRKQVRSLLILSCYIILTGLSKKQYLARVGIATGNFSIKENKEDKIIIGTAIVNAHQLEKKQNWIGGAILFNDYKPPYLEPGNKASLVANYTPPFEGETGECQRSYALNWLNKLILSMAGNCDTSEIERYLNDQRNEQKCQEIRTKYENTLNFIREMKAENYL